MPADNLALEVAAAIDTIHSVRFVALRAPDDAIPNDLDEAYSVAVGRIDGVHLSGFQRAGVSSQTVAQALRAGVLSVIENKRSES